VRFCVYLGSVCAFLGFSDLGLSRFISAYLGFISGLSRARGCAFSDLGLSRFISVYLGFISGLASSRVYLGLSRFISGLSRFISGLSRVPSSRVDLGSRIYLGSGFSWVISGLSRVYLGSGFPRVYLGSGPGWPPPRAADRGGMCVLKYLNQTDERCWPRASPLKPAMTCCCNTITKTSWCPAW
jgi:hypothetical protein